MQTRGRNMALATELWECEQGHVHVRTFDAETHGKKYSTFDAGSDAKGFSGQNIVNEKEYRDASPTTLPAIPHLAGDPPKVIQKRESDLTEEDKGRIVARLPNKIVSVQVPPEEARFTPLPAEDREKALRTNDSNENPEPHKEDLKKTQEIAERHKREQEELRNKQAEARKK